MAEPRLLVEPEPRHRIFLDNLTDLLLFRSAPQVATTSPPGVFWQDVFVHSPISWWSFFESLLWHMVAVVAVWAVSASSTMPKPATYKQAYSKSSLYYYPPSRTFSARTSSAPRPAPARHESPRQAAMRVAREQRRASSGGVAAPSAQVAGHARTPNLASPNPAMPSAPLAATGRAKLTLPSDWTSVVAPPPDLRSAAGRRGGLSPASVVEPPPDVSGVSGRRDLNGPSGVVIEPPPSAQDSLRGNSSPFGDGRAGGLSASGSSVVPPPPTMQGAVGGRGMGGLAGAGGSVVPPPPSVVGEGQGGSGRLGALAGGGSPIVPPPPSIQGTGNGGAGRLSSLSGGGSPIVPPPPSVQGVGNGGGGRGVGSLATGGSAIVPPPPSVQGTGHGGGGRLGTLGGGGSSVVPPPPSIQGAGHGGGGQRGMLAGGGLPVAPPPSLQGTGLGGSGTGAGGRGLGSFGSGLQVVPPPPSLQGAGNGGAGNGGSGRGLGSLNRGGSQVVPPPPSVQVAGHGGGGRGMGSLGGGDSVVPPPPSIGGAGGNGSGRPGPLGGTGTDAVAPPSGAGAGAGSGMYSGSTGPLAPMDALPTDAPNTGQPAAVPQETPGEDVPLRLVSMAMPTPGSSFFSNYEVYIAERRVRKGTSELIKLVYVFLPYQKRLSEYVQNNAKVYTLRVLRDPSCDESLMQMTWSEAEPASRDANNRDVFAAADKNNKLPCYRTTAEDYQRALERAR